ncbi:hypothetical protein [Sphingosinithalassobacter portus]|uniref:hypothetical protein n=1 Tax=Stakelama portus TaxID=2676234 RepID=UPI0011AB76BF|nr:hypothetical protein [Sphingosinithalassobacter portus]
MSKGVWALRLIVALCAAAVLMATVLPNFLSGQGVDILPFKWMTVFYGGIALLGLVGLGPIWLIVETTIFASKRQMNDGR